MLRLLLTVVLCLALAVPVAAGQRDCSGVAPVPGTELRLELVAVVGSPVDVTAIPGDPSRLFIVEQAGRVRLVELPDNLAQAPFLDIRSRVQCCGERGLLGLAFHPSYASNGELFVYYTSRPSGASVVSRFTVSGDANEVNAGTEEVLLTFSQPFSNHNAGQIRFGPNDGMLYIATGDGGSGGDPGNRAQSGTSLLGKLLRIDVDSTADNLAYGIPADNPFTETTGVRDEIWALGLRNPWRFAFDSDTGDLYIADVGQGTWEEIDFQPGTSSGGENYQWRVREGDHNFSSGTPFGVGTRIGPVYEYHHSSGAVRGRSITGGIVYRGCRMPALQGTYFFADYSSRWVRSFRLVGSAITEEIDRTAQLSTDLGTSLGGVSAFGEDELGEMYICDYSRNRVYRAIPAFVPPPTFTRSDANADKSINIADVTFNLDWLFGSAAAGTPLCLDSLDVNDDGNIDLSDPVSTLNYLFGSGGAPGPPFTECGVDPTEDGLDCENSICP